MMNIDINHIKANILDYEISFSILGWTVSDGGGLFSLSITEDLARELINLMKIENMVDTGIYTR